MRALPVLALMLGAGCVAPAQDAPSLAQAAVTGPLSPFTTIVDPEGGQGEPSLGIAPDGTLFASGLGYRNGIEAGGVYRSSDGGASWTLVAVPFVTPNYDPDLAVDAEGTVWFDTLWVGCSSAGSSRDGGATWTSSALACVPAAGDRQYLVPTTRGTAYIYSHQRPTYRQMVAKTTDHGATWMPIGSAEPLMPLHQRFVTEGSQWGGGGFWNAATGSVFFTFSWEYGSMLGATTWAPAFSVTRDAGATWELVKLPKAVGQPVGLSLVVGAADDAGNVYLAWAGSLEGGDDMAIQLSVSQDDGRTWTPPRRVDAGPGSRLFPAIAAGAEGRVAIAYYETDTEGYPAAVGDEAEWRVTLAWTADALADNATFEHGTLSHGLVRKGAICPDGFGCEGDRDLLDYFSIKTFPDGRVAGVWTSTHEIEGRTVNVYGATERALLR